MRDIKQEIDPFTGCFVSRLPITIVLLRYALKTVELISSGEVEEGLRLFTEGAARLPGAIGSFLRSGDFLREVYREEREAWDLYYDALDGIEAGLSAGDPLARELAERAGRCVDSVRIRE